MYKQTLKAIVNGLEEHSKYDLQHGQGAGRGSSTLQGIVDEK